MYFKGTGVFEGKKGKEISGRSKKTQLTSWPWNIQKNRFFFLGMSGTSKKKSETFHGLEQFPQYGQFLICIRITYLLTHSNPYQIY